MHAEDLIDPAVRAMLSSEALYADGKKKIWASKPLGQAVIKAELKLARDLESGDYYVGPSMEKPNTLHIDN